MYSKCMGTVEPDNMLSRFVVNCSGSVFAAGIKSRVPLLDGCWSNSLGEPEFGSS